MRRITATGRMAAIGALLWAAAAWGETFVSSAFRLDLRMEGGVREAEPVEIVQTSAAWQESLEAGGCVAEVTHRAPGADEAETLHRTTSPGTESFVWDALHAIPGDHAFTHTIRDGGTVVETMEMTYRVPEPRLEAIRIFGPTNFASGNSAQYMCMGYFSDGAGREVPATWSLDEGATGVEVAADGTLAAEQSRSDQTVTLHAVAEVAGMSAEDSLGVTVTAAWLRLRQDALNVEKDAGEWSVAVSCSGAWSAESTEDWLTLIEPGGEGDGLVAFSVTKNTNASTRRATVNLACGILSAKLAVKQDPGQEVVRVTVLFDPRGGEADYASHEYLTGDTYGTLPKAWLAGQVFGGWWTQPNGQGTRVIQTTEVSADIEQLYAFWRGLTVADALNGALDWTDGGDTPWVIDTDTRIDGVASMRSGAIGNNGTSTLMAEVTGPGTLSFWWRTSSDESFDKVMFFVDETPSTALANPVAQLSGETGWEHCNVEIPGERQILRWVYAKDAYDGVGRDCAWLDGVVWMPRSVTQSGGAPDPAPWFGLYGLDYATQANEDSDGDGLTNIEEWTIGSDPLVEDGFSLTLVSESDGLHVVPVPYLGEQREYIIEGKANLDDDQWVSPTNATHRFFRGIVKTKEP